MKTKIIVLMLIGMMGFAGSAFGQEAVPDSVASDVEAAETADEVSRLMTIGEIGVAADSIMGGYDADWTDLSMQGKLSFDGLPMSVSVKVYMKRGEAIILSARAPFFGEVARVEASQDSITFINKHTRCYHTEPLGGALGDRVLPDLQDVLLGQVAFPGHGRLTTGIAVLSQWIALPTGEALIYPTGELQTAGIEYGFVMDSVDWQLKTFVLMLQQSGTVLETSYLYGDKGWTLGLEVALPKKKLQGEVQLSYPDYDGSPLEFTTLGSKYRKVDFRELLKF